MACNVWSKNLVFQECLGNGSYGIVFASQIKRQLIRKSYAVKLVYKESSLSKNEQRELEREAELTRLLPVHPNIVRVFDVVEDSYTPRELQALWMTTFEMPEDFRDRQDVMLGRARRNGSVPLVLFQMELCGRTLRHWLNDDRTKEMSPDILHSDQFQILQDFSEGLKFLHSNKIIHRDIKPENTMFSLPPNPSRSDGYAFPLKLGDFGLCRKFHSDETKTSTLTSKVGTLDYIAPEVMLGEYGKQCDIYSFGLVAWEVIQLIPYKSRKKMFDALVNDRDYSILDFHANFLGMENAIIKMTMRKTSERTQSLDDFNLTNIPHKWRKLRSLADIIAAHR